jgi:hypothetical protein
MGTGVGNDDHVARAGAVDGRGAEVARRSVPAGGGAERCELDGDGPAGDRRNSTQGAQSGQHAIDVQRIEGVGQGTGTGLSGGGDLGIGSAHVRSPFTRSEYEHNVRLLPNVVNQIAAVVALA